MIRKTARVLKELVFEMWLGIISPSKLAVPSIAVTERGRRYYGELNKKWFEDASKAYAEAFGIGTAECSQVIIDEAAEMYTRKENR